MLHGKMKLDTNSIMLTVLSGEVCARTLPARTPQRKTALGALVPAEMHKEYFGAQFFAY
jgi:hypothetical protein